MSSSLSWQPVHPEQDNSLCNQLKFLLRKKYGNPVDAIMSGSDLPYLEGIVDSDCHSSKGAKQLIKIINKNHKIHVREVY